MAPEHVGDRGLDGGATGRAVHVPRVSLGQLWLVEHVVAQPHELTVVLNADQDGIAVTELEQAVGHDRRMAEADPRPLEALLLEAQQGHGHPVRHRVEERGLDSSAGAGEAALDQGFEDGRVRVDAGGEVADGHADPAGLRRRTGDRGDAALSLDEQVVGAHRSVGAVLAVARDVAGDQSRMALPKVLRSEAGAPGRTRSEVLNEHVRAFDHPFEQGAVLRVLDVENDGLLAPVQPGEVGRDAARSVVAAGEVAAVAFDLDHPGARIRQPAGRQRRRDRLLDGHDEQTVKGAVGGHRQANTGCS